MTKEFDVTRLTDVRRRTRKYSYSENSDSMHLPSKRKQTTLPMHEECLVVGEDATFYKGDYELFKSKTQKDECLPNEIIISSHTASSTDSKTPICPITDYTDLSCNEQQSNRLAEEYRQRVSIQEKRADYLYGNLFQVQQRIRLLQRGKKKLLELWSNAQVGAHS